MLKRIFAFLAALLLMCSLPLCAFAGSDLILIEDGDESGNEAQVSEETPQPDYTQQPGDYYGQSYTLPDWYPEDVSSFQFFTNPNAERVVDLADIFTDEQEAQMRRRIAEISALTAKDIVVYTDITAYGMEHNMLAADFYDFNGYGIGESRDGMILFICMDELDRGWQEVSTGSVEQLHTQSNAAALDDRLYNYLVSARYGEGVLDWIENIESLYTKGIPFAPDWYTTEYVAPVSYDASRVADEAGLFSAGQRSELDRALRDIRDTYGIDAVVHTADNSYGMGYREYASAFYTMHGYGLGSTADGALLVLFTDGTMRMYVSGAASAKLDGENTDKLLEASAEKLSAGDKGFSAVLRWIKYLGKTLKSGRVPIAPEAWGRKGFFGSLVGGVAGLISLVTAKSKMKVVNKAVSAQRNLVTDSLRVRSDDRLINVTVSQTYSPQNQDQGGGRSGGGHSSYGGGFSGHSGSSHTSSGGRF